METVKTLKLRIKDKHAKVLLAMARDVNTVWNFCNETQYRSLRRYTNKPNVWLSGFDLQELTSGFSKYEGVSIDSTTVQVVCEEFATRLRQFKKQRLNWRGEMAKSVYDAAWTTFRTQLKYKAMRQCVMFEEINEAFSTQTCSCCGEIPNSSPKDRASLRIKSDLTYVFGFWVYN